MSTNNHIKDTDFIKTSLKLRFAIYKKVNALSVNQRQPVYQIINALLEKQLKKEE